MVNDVRISRLIASGGNTTMLGAGKKCWRGGPPHCIYVSVFAFRVGGPSRAGGWLTRVAG